MRVRGFQWRQLCKKRHAKRSLRAAHRRSGSLIPAYEASFRSYLDLTSPTAVLDPGQRLTHSSTCYSPVKSLPELSADEI